MFVVLMEHISCLKIDYATHTANNIDSNKIVFVFFIKLHQCCTNIFAFHLTYPQKYD